MAKFKSTFQSARTIDETFAYLADFSNARFWDPSVSAAIRLDSSQLAVGSKFTLQAKFWGRVLALNYEIDVLEPVHRLVFVADLPLGRSVDEIVVVRSDMSLGCTVTYDARVYLSGRSRLLEPLVALEFQRTARRACTGLQRELA